MKKRRRRKKKAARFNDISIEFISRYTERHRSMVFYLLFSASLIRFFFFYDRWIFFNPFIAERWILSHCVIIYAQFCFFYLFSVPYSKWSWQTFANEEYVNRNWLAFSLSLDCLRCCCNSSNCSQIKMWIGQFKSGFCGATITKIAVFILISRWNQAVACFYWLQHQSTTDQSEFRCEFAILHFLR